VFWYWIFAGPALALAIRSLRGERARAAYIVRRLSESSSRTPPATVIVPVKGEDQDLRENLAALASLDYPDYELLIVARSAADIPPGVLPPRARIVLSHADDPSTGEKIGNLLAAVAVARQRSRIYAFADSDVCVTSRWLRALAAPLDEPGVGASTAYRWFLPPPQWGGPSPFVACPASEASLHKSERSEPHNPVSEASLPSLSSLASAPSSLLRSVWDAVTFGLMGPGDNRFAWGGSMAIRKRVFREIGVAEFWKGAVSDDFTLSAAVHAAGLTIAFAPAALAPCFDSIGPLALFAWMRRQATITRFHDHPLWLAGLVAHAVYCAGMAASFAAALAGSRVAAFVLVAQFLPGMFKGFRRASQARAALPEHAARFRRVLWAHVLLVPMATWMWLASLAASAHGDTILWRGRRYNLRER
jgi:cellulose synthase/poly-beta-1,6-N-acetylglucosamine synthase-like glycosyltransferase